MKTVPVLALCLLFLGCTDRETKSKLEAIDAQAKDLKSQIEKVAAALPQVDRFKMFNGTVGSGDLAFLYDTQTGRVWRYYRNWSEDKKDITAEGFSVLFDPAHEFPDRIWGVDSNPSLPLTPKTMSAKEYLDRELEKTPTK